MAGGQDRQVVETLDPDDPSDEVRSRAQAAFFSELVPSSCLWDLPTPLPLKACGRNPFVYSLLRPDCFVLSFWSVFLSSSYTYTVIIKTVQAAVSFVSYCCCITLFSRPPRVFQSVTTTLSFSSAAA